MFPPIAAPRGHDSPLFPGHPQVAVALGDSHTYLDGVSVWVSPPELFLPTWSAFGPGPSASVAIAYAVFNGSDRTLEVRSFPTVSSAGVRVSTIADIGNPALVLDVYGEHTLPPGTSFTWTEGYSVTDADDLTIQVSPSPGYTAVTFRTPGPTRPEGSAHP